MWGSAASYNRAVHPTPAFHWDTRDELLAFVTQRAFATVCATVGGELVAAQVPVIVDGDGALLLHLSRANAVARALAAAPLRVLVVVGGPDAYVSPDWYVEPHQVPTWNYLSVEVRGELATTDEATLVTILERQSALFEARLAGKPPWTLDKLPPAVLAAKLKGIVGARLAIDSIRGTRKLSQNKTADDRAAVSAALAPSRRDADREIASLVGALRSTS